jgi:hypothetical protein
VFVESRNSNLDMGHAFCAECISPERRNAASPGIGNGLVDFPEIEDA